MNIEMMKVTEITPYKDNPRKNDKAVEYVANSIREFGFKVPIVIDRDNVIVTGHTRWKAARKLGLSEVPCIKADDLNEEQITAFRLADNKVSELAEWDDKLLEKELAKIDDLTLNMGYEGAGNTPDSKRKKSRIMNDKMPDEEFERFITKAYEGMFYAMKEGASCYVFYKELGKGVFITAMEQGGLTFKQELIWVKSQLVLGGSKYQSIYEPCLLGCKGKSIKFWYTGRKERSVIESIDLMNEDELREAYKELFDYLELDIIREKKQLVNDLHPTMKPVKLIAKFIRNSSKVGDIVFDLFAGSGTTLIAGEQLDRKCRCMELDPKYCDVIVKRWENFTGRKAERIN